MKWQLTIFRRCRFVNAVNSAYNVGSPQLRRIKEEMLRALMLLDQGGGKWRKIFEKSDFFARHSNYLQITIRADSAANFLKWQRLCESRMRLLITSLETTEVMAWPFAKFFRREFNYRGYAVSSEENKTQATSAEKGTNNAEIAVGEDDACCNDNDKSRFRGHQSDFFIALRFAPGVETFNLKYLASDFLHKVNSWEERTEDMDLQIAHVLQQHLPRALIGEGLAGIEATVEGPSHAVPDFRKILGSGASPASSSSSRPNTPVDQGDESTGLTPKVARSTLACDEILGSPTKRARNDDKK